MIDGSQSHGTAFDRDAPVRARHRSRLNPNHDQRARVQATISCSYSSTAPQYMSDPPSMSRATSLGEDIAGEDGAYPEPPKNWGKTPAFGALASLYNKLSRERQHDKRRKAIDTWFEVRCVCCSRRSTAHLSDNSNGAGWSGLTFTPSYGYSSPTRTANALYTE